MQGAALQVKVVTAAMIYIHYQWTIQITNNSKQLAFFINPQLMTGEAEILPGFWSDNYFSILAGESEIVTLNCVADKLNSAKHFKSRMMEYKRKAFFFISTFG
jgi:hypothetical protein